MTVPIDLLQGLQAASSRDLAQVEILGPGVAIAWPKINQQFSITGLIAGVFGTRAWMAELARRRAANTKTSAAKPASRAKSGRRRNTRQEA